MEEPRWGKHHKRVDLCIWGSQLCPQSSSLTGSSLCDTLMIKQSHHSLHLGPIQQISLFILFRPYYFLLSSILSTQTQASRSWALQEPVSLGRNNYLQTQRDTGTNSTRKTGEQEARGQPWLHKTIKTSLGSMRPCFKATKINKSWLGCLENITTTRCSCS